MSAAVLASLLLAVLAVEAFNERLLRRLAELDEVQLHAALFRPEKHRLAGQLTAVVPNDLVGRSVNRKWAT